MTFFALLYVLLKLIALLSVLVLRAEIMQAEWDKLPKNNSKIYLYNVHPFIVIKKIYALFFGAQMSTYRRRTLSLSARVYARAPYL